MKKAQMVVRKRTQGRVSYNDGEFTEVEVSGIEGSEEGLFLNTVQFHRCDTSDTPEEFQHRFPVGARLDIVTITEITALEEVVGSHG